MMTTEEKGMYAKSRICSVYVITWQVACPGQWKKFQHNAIGHDTTQCRTKDPVTIKKRVANNQKIKKESATLQARFPIPPRLHPYHQYFGDPIIPYQQPLQTYYANIADAKELRRRKTQSTWDKRRKGATSSS